MEIFVELGFILLITTTVSLVARFFKQPLVVGYIASGVIVGPYVFNILKSTDSIELFSKIGISILLFIVGLSLNPSTVKESGKASLVTGIGQIVFTSLFGFLIMKGLGFDTVASLYGAVALTFSSTIIILKLLSDRGDLGKLYGKISVGFLLVQDIVATLFLILIPLFGSYLVNSQVQTSGALMFLSLFLKGAGISILLYLLSKYVLPKFLGYLAKSQELLFLFSVTWGLVMAGLFYKIGFSIEIGALIAGVTLSASNYASEISSRMRSLRDFFIVLFFVLLGSQVVLGGIGAMIIPAIVLSAFVLIGNPLIVFVLMNLLGYRRRTSFMAGLTVAQISEFSLIMMALGLSLGHVTQDVVSLITLVGIITISGSTYLFMYSDKIYSTIKKKLSILEFRKIRKESSVDLEKTYQMILFGYGRVGHEFVMAAKELGMSYLVVDYNPATANRMGREDVVHIFGDAEDVEFLDEIKLTGAEMFISTIPDPYINALLVKYYRKENKEGIAILTSHTIPETIKFYESGATYVVMPHYLGAYHASSMLIQSKDNPQIFQKEKDFQMSQIKDSY